MLGGGGEKQNKTNKTKTACPLWGRRQELRGKGQTCTCLEVHRGVSSRGGKREEGACEKHCGLPTGRPKMLRLRRARYSAALPCTQVLSHPSRRSPGTLQMVAAPHPIPQAAPLRPSSSRLPDLAGGILPPLSANSCQGGVGLGGRARGEFAQPAKAILRGRLVSCLLSFLPHPPNEPR